jgi:hypothetical protein
MVIIAAWFHDTDISKELKIMKTKVYALFLILKEKDKSDEYIQKIASIIRATTFNHVPQTLLKKIIRDADYFHLPRIIIQ